MEDLGATPLEPFLNPYLFTITKLINFPNFTIITSARDGDSIFLDQGIINWSSVSVFHLGAM
ncbi:MAG: hypothetical protein EBV05_00060 [Cyanobacteria bacterium WB6_1B_304]|nr:hypothetical protein [Cyanobacteria bacterium WB6_1B_304]